FTAMGTILWFGGHSCALSTAAALITGSGLFTDSVFVALLFPGTGSAVGELAVATMATLAGANGHSKAAVKEMSAVSWMSIVALKHVRSCGDAAAVLHVQPAGLVTDEIDIFAGSG